MTTESWSSRVRHDSDAVFREWGAELSGKLSDIGLVQTADTGQINWASVNRPGTNTSAGYEIWRFDDTMQATAPIFIRVDYGTGGSANAPRIQITVGTGSNGSGTITGTALTTARSITASSATQTTDTVRNSYACHTEGFLGLAWKLGSASDGCFFVCRTCDSSGDPNDTGALVYWGAGTSSNITATQALRFASTAAAFTAQTTLALGMLGFNPQSPTSTAVGSDIQVMLGWTITPRVAPLFAVCGVLDAELTTGVSFSATLVGTTARTLIALSTSCPFSPSGTGQLKIAMLWE